MLPESQQALAGWRKRCPDLPRYPVPLNVVWLICDDMLDHGDKQASAAAAIQVDGYLRPGEVCNLRTADVTRPRALAGKGYGRWGVLLGNSAEGETTKTGQVDDTVIIGDKVRQWTASLLRSITLGAEAKRSEFLFPTLTLRAYDTAFRRSVARLKLNVTVTPPYLRHSGPSADSLSRSRSLPQIKKRGR